MNRDIFEGKWNQMRGQAKSWWGELTDDDFDRAGGKYDEFTGLLQEKYGYTREQAVEEIDQHVTEFENNFQEPQVSNYAEETMVTEDSIETDDSMETEVPSYGHNSMEAVDSMESEDSMEKEEEI